MAGVVADPGHPLDHLGHALKRPELIAEAVRQRPLKQGRLQRPDLVGGQSGSPAGPAGACQRRLTLSQPASVPDAGGLNADLQLSGDLGRPGPAREECRRLLATLGQGREVTSRP